MFSPVFRVTIPLEMYAQSCTLLTLRGVLSGIVGCCGIHDS